MGKSREEVEGFVRRVSGKYGSRGKGLSYFQTLLSIINGDEELSSLKLYEEKITSEMCEEIRQYYAGFERPLEILVEYIAEKNDNKRKDERLFGLTESDIEKIMERITLQEVS